MLALHRSLLAFVFISIPCAFGCSGSSSNGGGPVIDSFSAPAQVTADSAGNYELVATFSAHDDSSTIAKVDFRATNLADNPIATDNQPKYVDQPVKLTLVGAPKGKFAYSFVVIDAAGASATSQQSIELQ